MDWLLFAGDAAKGFQNDPPFAFARHIFRPFTVSPYAWIVRMFSGHAITRFPTVHHERRRSGPDNVFSGRAAFLSFSRVSPCTVDACARKRKTERSTRTARTWIRASALFLRTLDPTARARPWNGNKTVGFAFEGARNRKSNFAWKKKKKVVENRTKSSLPFARVQYEVVVLFESRVTKVDVLECKFWKIIQAVLTRRSRPTWRDGS